MRHRVHGSGGHIEKKYAYVLFYMISPAHCKLPPTYKHGLARSIYTQAYYV